MSASDYSGDEMMTVTAARQLRNGAVCFVGIGLPSAACNLARLTHAPDLVLIYESGTRSGACVRRARLQAALGSPIPTKHTAPLRSCRAAVTVIISSPL